MIVLLVLSCGESTAEPTSCTVTGGGVEACDGVDNDCNGLVDDNLVAERCGVGQCSDGQCVGLGHQNLPVFCFKNKRPVCEPREGNDVISDIEMEIFARGSEAEKDNARHCSIWVATDAAIDGDRCCYEIQWGCGY